MEQEIVAIKGAILKPIGLSPGEFAQENSRFSPSLILFWFKTTVTVTNMRVHWNLANSLFGAIPLGYTTGATPLSAVATVAVNVQFSVKTALFGVFWLVLGFVLLGGNAMPLGVLFCLFGVVSILNALKSTLQIIPNGGSPTSVSVSILEKGKLEAMAQRIQNQLFTNHRHLDQQQNVAYQQSSLNVQNATLGALQNMQPNAGQNLGAQFAPGQGPAAHFAPGQGTGQQQPPAGWAQPTQPTQPPAYPQQATPPANWQQPHPPMPPAPQPRQPQPPQV